MSEHETLMPEYSHIIPDFTTFLQSLERPLPVHLRVNTLKVARERFLELAQKKGYELKPIPWYPDAFLALNLESPGTTLEYFLGYYYPQGLSSMIPPLLLDPQPEETVLDLCAAPGGKTSQLAQLMQNRGLIVANDITMHRLRSLKANLERLGILNTLTTQYHGQNFPTRFRFDRVLVDAPCSGSGTYRGKQGEQGIERPAWLIRRLSKLQKQLIVRAFDLLKPGGCLVYSTCTYAPEENEEVIAHLLQTREDAVLEEIQLPFPHATGLTDWQGKAYPEALKRCVRVYPHQLDSWGFFYAKITRPR
ncbi:MAG: RsmB/NOP family class I SAM-dependent RNA methyltransferase [Nitrospinota bacterium]|nr:MAG: RsmB/NOP family class I SAM-dependent RNA methyltransferase [Nitrospinota bacterium]